MAKSKKELSPTQELKQLKAKQRILFAGEIGSSVLPFAFTAIFNFNDVIAKTEAWRVSLTFVLTAFMTLISVAVIAKGKFKVNLFTPLLVLGVFDAWLFIMGDIITKLAWITLYIIAGFMGAFVLELAKNNKKDTERIAILEEGIKKDEVDVVAENHRQERETVKIRIKK